MSLFTKIQSDAETQKLYLAVVDQDGVEYPQYGKVELRLDDIRAILAATTPTAVDGSAGNEPGAIRFREVQICLPDGSQGYLIGVFGGTYTKP